MKLRGLDPLGDYRHVLPPHQAAQHDLAAVQQAEEQQQHRLLAGQRRLGLGAAAKLLVDALQGVGGSQRLPLRALACAEAASRATTQLLAAGFHSRQRVFNCIASASFSLPVKRSMVDASSAEIDRTRTVLTEILSRACAPAEVAALYGDLPDDVLVLVATRADCLTGDTYVQDAVRCPAPLCGTRLRERDEECDDGTTSRGDGCSAACRREAASPG